MWHRWSLHRASRKMTFYSLTTHIHLSSSHLCAETMTVRVACSARWPRRLQIEKRKGSTGVLRAPASQGVPGCFASIPPPPPPLPPPPTSLFAKVRAQSAELFPSNCLAGSGCRCYCFCAWFCLPALSSFLSPGSCQCWLPGRLVCAFLRSWKNVAHEREVEVLASATCELLFF